MTDSIRSAGAALRHKRNGPSSLAGKNIATPSTSHATTNIAAPTTLINGNKLQLHRTLLQSTHTDTCAVDDTTKQGPTALWETFYAVANLHSLRPTGKLIIHGRQQK